MSDSGMNPPPPPVPPPPPPSSPYGSYGGMGGGMGPHPQGTTILVLGILSVVCCGPLGIAAWIMGNKAYAEVEANPGAYTNGGVVQAGRILGIIGCVFMVLSIIWLVFLGGLSTLEVTNNTSEF